MYPNFWSQVYPGYAQVICTVYIRFIVQGIPQFHGTGYTQGTRYTQVQCTGYTKVPCKGYTHSQGTGYVPGSMPRYIQVQCTGYAHVQGTEYTQTLPGVNTGFLLLMTLAGRRTLTELGWDRSDFPLTIWPTGSYSCHCGHKAFTRVRSSAEQLVVLWTYIWSASVDSGWRKLIREQLLLNLSSVISRHWCPARIRNRKDTKCWWNMIIPRQTWFISYH